MQSYERLHRSTSYECIAIAADYGTTPELAFPIRTPASIEGLVSRLHPMAGTAVDLSLARLGANNYLLGLDEALGGVDVVHTVETYWLFSAQAASYCERTDTPLVVTQWENVPYNSDGKRLRRRCKRYVRRRADAFVAITDRAAFALRTEGIEADRITVIPPGVDTDRFAPPDARVDSDGCTPTGDPEDTERLEVLFVGRLNRVKGLYFLLHAIRRLRRMDVPAFRLSLVGSGPDAAALRRYVDRLGVADRVAFEGTLSYDTMAERYRSADVFVLPSIPVEGWQEQFGMVLVKVMASGLPIVTTRSGSIPEVVGDTAELVQPADGYTLADSLRTPRYERYSATPNTVERSVSGRGDGPKNASRSIASPHVRPDYTIPLTESRREVPTRLDVPEEER